jgi:hypothetical protein
MTKKYSKDEIILTNLSPIKTGTTMEGLEIKHSFVTDPDWEPYGHGCSDSCSSCNYCDHFYPSIALKQYIQYVKRIYYLCDVKCYNDKTRIRSYKSNIEHKTVNKQLLTVHISDPKNPVCEYCCKNIDVELFIPYIHYVYGGVGICDDCGNSKKYDNSNFYCYVCNRSFGVKTNENIKTEIDCAETIRV